MDLVKSKKDQDDDKNTTEYDFDESTMDSEFSELQNINSVLDLSFS